MKGIALEVIFGAVVAILITIIVENVRKPKLEIKLAEHHDNAHLQNRPAKSVRFLAVDLLNKPLPWLFRWMSRSAALQSHGSISFHHLDGQNVFGRSMPIRWSGSPEPVPIHLQIDNTRVLIADPARLSLISRMDVYPGEKQRLDVSAKFDDEKECYGWSNESYFSDPAWRNPDWKIPYGRYLVKVTVISSGEKVSGIYRLINDVAQLDFRLEEATLDDKSNVRD